MNTMSTESEPRWELLELQMEELEKESCMHGYHVYSAILDVEIGQQVSCIPEPRNGSHWYAIAVVNSSWCLKYFKIPVDISTPVKYMC